MELQQELIKLALTAKVCKDMGKILKIVFIT
jgi:hypothetical protein